MGAGGSIPSLINKEYVLAIVEVFLTNGNGTAWNAEPVYRSLIDLFDTNQAFLAVLAFSNDNITSRLQFKLCEQKYRELLELMNIKISMPALKELVEDIENFSGPIDALRKDSRIKQKVNNITKILGISISL